jgi:sorbitol/mannitol transport system permease protein
MTVKAALNRSSSQKSGRTSTIPAFLLLLPALAYLILTTQAPFLMTIYYSLFRYSLVDPFRRPFVGLDNYVTLFTDPLSVPVLVNTLVLVLSVIALTIALGGALALLFNRKFFARNLARTLLIGPFFVMPVITALIWKNSLYNPVFGLFSEAARAVGLPAIDWLAKYPMPSIIAMVTWEWTPFAMLILLTSLQSLPQDQLEAARLDGASSLQEFRFIVLPHLSKAVEVIVLLEAIFILQIYGEIYISTSGGPGLATTNLPYFIFQKAFAEYSIGMASAAGVLAVVLANIVTAFFLRLVNRNVNVKVVPQ